MHHIIRLQRTEYRWIKNIINVAKKDIRFRNDIKSGIKDGKIGVYTNHILTWNPKIGKDKHSYDSKRWCVIVASEILKNGPQFNVLWDSRRS